MNSSSAPPLRLLLVDDHSLFLEGAVRLLESKGEFRIVGAVQTLADAEEVLSREAIDVLLLDFDLGRESAGPLVERLQAAGFQGRVLIVTAGLSMPEAINILRAGAAGILHKHQSSDTLCDAVRKVAAGEAYLEPQYLPSVLRTLQPAEEGRARLTEREAKVLRFVFQGLANKEIAVELGLSESGVKAILRVLFEKLGVRTRSQAVRVALEQYRDQL